MGQLKAKDLTGCMVALVTPMNPDGSINISEWEQLVKWHCHVGTDAIVVAGTTGESVLLSTAEIKLLTQSAVNICQQSNTRIIVGTGTIDPEKVIEANRNALANGAAAVLVVTPYYLTLTQAALVQHFTYIAENTELPIILYNVPSRTAIDIQAQTTATLAQLDNVIGIKEAKADMQRIQQLLKVKNFAVLSGDDGTFNQAIQLGAHGVISVAANVRPKSVKGIYNQVQLGDLEAANRLNEEMTTLYDFLFHEPNPCPVKSIMHRADMLSSGIRKPLVMTKLNDSQVKPFIKSIIQEFNSI